MTVKKDLSSNGQNGHSVTIKAAPMLFSCRFALFILCMFSTFTFLLQRINIGFALVCMVKRPLIANITFEENNSSIFGFDDHTESPLEGLTDDDICKQHAAALTLAKNQTAEELVDQGEFEWSKDVQGSILASFYYGYLFTQIFGGWLVERFGARLGLISSLISISLLTILNPIAARYGTEILFAARFLMGATHGGALSSINIFSVRWCSPAERGFLMGIAYGGFCLAAAFTFPICAVLCKNFGWEYIFYGTGAFGLVIAFAAYFMAYDWPESHPRISERELEYLQKSRAVPYSTGQSRKNQTTPWRSILLSVPVNVVHITHACFVWGFLMIGMYLPTFMKEVLYMDTTKNGMYSSLPYIGMLTIHFTVGSVFDFLRKKNLMSLTNLRKLFNTVGMIAPASALIAMGSLSCTSPGLGIILVSLVNSLAEFAFMGGYMFSIFELAPKYAGVLTGITNTFGVVPGFLCPALVAWMTRDATRDQWIRAFGVSGGIVLFGAVVYLLFGSCELQPWAKQGNPKDEEMKEIQGEKLLTEGEKNGVKKSENLGEIIKT